MARNDFMYRMLQLAEQKDLKKMSKLKGKLGTMEAYLLTMREPTLLNFDAMETEYNANRLD